ncbi:ATP-binding SpoIIE family protein phosphatase [Streptomyces sp. NPDC049585]|uniref:ATP-binding SpoIIE family protein phosphatase n=1 Tax=Streptomyces sp. NPDC049585 TaxID=3155154 RepID=UPI003424D05C
MRTSPTSGNGAPVARAPSRRAGAQATGGCTGESATARTSLPGDARAPSAARRFVRTVLAGWNAHDVVTYDATLLVSELVTNAVVHAGTSVDLECRLDPARGGSLVVEVTDHHPTREFRARRPAPGERDGPAHCGRGLRLVAELAETWGTAYRRTDKTVWFHLPTSRPDRAGEPPALSDQALLRDLRVAENLGPGSCPEPPARPAADTGRHRALSFLAEASELLAGQFDEDTVASLAAQLAVPRLADWCAVWLDAESTPGTIHPAPRLSCVWHADERRTEPLRAALLHAPPLLPATGRPAPWPYRQDPPGPAPTGAPPGPALACRLVAGGRALGTLLLGRPAGPGLGDDVTGLTEDFARRLAQALASARQYTRQATISTILQRGLLPRGVAHIPGIDKAVVYEPCGDTAAGGDFYDVFAAGDDRWCFALGDVCGSGPEAAVTTGLVRPWLRLLAKEGYGVADVLTRLNRMLAEEAAEDAPGPAPRFLSLLHGQLVPRTDGGSGVRCTLASAGHPLPLLLRPDGSVRAVGAPQILLGVVEEVAYSSQTFDMAAGDTLLCVTDGVTERKAGNRLFDDADGLAATLTACTGLTAEGVARRIRDAVHAFAPTPPDDDLALLVLRAE